MRIVNPTFGTRTEEKGAAAKATSVDWMNDPIILFSNSKPNVKEIMEALRQKLSALRNVDQVDFIAKNAAGVPAPTEMIEAIAGKYRIALLGSAD